VTDTEQNDSYRREEPWRCVCSLQHQAKTKATDQTGQNNLLFTQWLSSLFLKTISTQ